MACLNSRVVNRVRHKKGRVSVKLPAGKIPKEILEGVVFSHLGVKRDEVVVGPSYGLDGAVIRIGNKHLVTSMDPITGALERVGWLAININANDVATFGVRPAFFSSCLLLPKSAIRETVRTICAQIDSGANRLGIAVTGGHAEATPGLPFPIVVGCCLGVAQEGNYVTAKGAETGNELILTKTPGIEGTAILAADRYERFQGRIEEPILTKAKGFFSFISVVQEALLAFETGYVTAMHDPTEGGVAGGIHELAHASELGFRVYEERIPIAEETLRICEFFKIDPLRLIASGSLLIAAEKGYGKEVVKVLEKNRITANVIGELVPSQKKKVLVRKNGRIEDLAKPESDHLWIALAK